MKIAATLNVVAALFAPLAQGERLPAAHHILPDGYHVTACLQPGTHPAVSIRAQFLAARMFAGIGLSLDWARDCRVYPEDMAIRISLQTPTPADELPGALGYSTSQQGAQIVVFYDRVVKTVEVPDIPVLLAHVLVHEITHVLQGFKYHSETGLMRARWSGADYNRMAVQPLRFTDADVWLIRRGLEDGHQNRFVRRVNR